MSIVNMYRPGKSEQTFTRAQLRNAGWSDAQIEQYCVTVPVDVPTVAVAQERARSKACDEMFGVILTLPEDRRRNLNDVCEALYDAGYRK